MNYCYYLLLCLVVIFYRAFSFTCLAPMQIYWNKGKRLHEKRVQLLHDWFGTPTKIGQTTLSQTPVLSKNDQKPIIALFSLMKESFDYLYLRLLRLEKLLSWLVPDLFLSILICAQKKAGRRKRERLFPLFFLSPSLGPLRFVTSHSRFALAFVRNKSARNEAPPQVS